MNSMGKFNIWETAKESWEDDPKHYKFLAKIKGTNFYFVTDYFKDAKTAEERIIDSEVLHRIDETGMEIK